MADGLTHTIGHDLTSDIMSGVTIARPVHEVYAFYADMTHFPQFLGDVTDVEPAGPNRYRWTIEGPLGIPVHWMVDILKARPDAMLCYGTEVTAGLRGTWTTTFEPVDQGAGTRVTQRLHMPFRNLSNTILTLMGKSPQGEVEANLQRLKELLETGRVTTTAHAVPGKFAPK